MLPSDVLTIEQVAAELLVAPSTIRALIKVGQLPAFRVGRQYRLTRAQLDTFRERAAVAPVVPVARRPAPSPRRRLRALHPLERLPAAQYFRK